MIISDIHGSEKALTKALQKFKEFNCDYLLVAGDILYYGPRNCIPDGHNPQGVASLLNEMNTKIVAIRGNCDAEVDQMLLDFPCLSDYALIADNGKRIFLTHGHVYNPQNMPKGDMDILICGHTHLWNIERINQTVCCNVGSITFPKGGNEATFGIYEGGSVGVYSLNNGKCLQEYNLDSTVR